MALFDPGKDIRILREPMVYLVGRQVIDSRELDRVLADHGVSWQSDTEVAAEYLTEVAGRVCYMSFAKPRPGGNKVYLDHILEVGHGSVLEHAVWNFVITGVSRTLTHELVRHRAGWAYSQLSQRYVDEKEEPDKTLRRKLARQAARSVLPNATETKIFVSANARALRHFIELRGSRHAEVEIRKLAIKVLEIMKMEAPHIFGDYQLTSLPDGTFEATTEHRKV